MKKFLFTLIWLFCTHISYSQKNDMNWILGDDVGVNFNDNRANFFEVLSKYRGRYPINIPWTIPCISDTGGQLVFYLDYKLDDLGLDSLYIKDNSRFRNKFNEIIAYQDSLIEIPDSILKVFGNGPLVLNSLTKKGIYYVLSFATTWYMPFNRISNLHKSIESKINLYFQVIDMNANNGKGAIVKKQSKLSSSSMITYLAATKHSNGLDWWIIGHGRDSSRTFYKYLLNEDGIKLHSTQDIGEIIDSAFHTQYKNYAADWLSSFTFSPDGQKLVHTSLTGIMRVFSFNRCTGDLYSYVDLSDPKLRSISNSKYTYQEGDYIDKNGYLFNCISPDGKKIFTGGRDYILQYDISDPSKIKRSVDSLSNYVNLSKNSLKIYFYKLTPDNKIWVYLTPNTFNNPTNKGQKYIGVINKPNGFGPKNYNFRYKDTMLPDGKISETGFPNFPNFRLGASPNFSRTDMLLCRNDSIKLGSYDACPYNYSWSGLKVADSTVKILSYKFDSVGVYKFWRHQFSASQGCTTAVDTFVIEVQNKHILSSRTDTLICWGSTLKLGKDLGESYKYSWSGLKVADSTAKIITHRFERVGVYKFWRHRVPASQGCTTTVDTFVVMVKKTAPPCVTALEKHIIPKAKVKIYPNPTKDNFMITSNQRVLRVRLYDINGKKITEYISDGYPETLTFNVDTVPRGIYLCEVDTEGGKITQRVVVER